MANDHGHQTIAMMATGHITLFAMATSGHSTAQAYIVTRMSQNGFTSQLFRTCESAKRTLILAKSARTYKALYSVNALYARTFPG